MTQNGQRPAQQGSRPQGTSQSRKNGPFKPVITVAVIATAVLLILAILAGTVAVAVAGISYLVYRSNTEQSDDSGSGGGNKPSKPSSKDENSKDIVDSSLNLPSKTASGSYLSTGSPSKTIGTDISSAAAVLVDLSANQVIAGKQADERIYPASMTKVMTLLVACENATEGGRLLTVEQEMIKYAQDLGASGNLGFMAGDKISVEDALYLINYRSDTISCLMIAKHIAGSEAAFVELMNEKAVALGLTGTHFVNTTGLHDANHYTTCREMAAIMSCAMNNPVAKKILTAYSGRAISIYDANYVKYRNPMVYSGWYSDRLGDNSKVSGSDIKITGGKTGYEDIPTSCFVTVAQDTKTQKQYICVVVGRTNEGQTSVTTSQSTTDTRNIYKSYT